MLLTIFSTVSKDYPTFISLYFANDNDFMHFFWKFCCILEKTVLKLFAWYPRISKRLTIHEARKIWPVWVKLWLKVVYPVMGIILCRFRHRALYEKCRHDVLMVQPFRGIESMHSFLSIAWKFYVSLYLVNDFVEIFTRLALRGFLKISGNPLKAFSI